MSTTYYIANIPTKEKKQEFIDAINNDDVLSLWNSSFESLYNVREIGHRAGGWLFSWNPFLNEIKTFTKEEIINLVNRNDVIIFDEYHEKQDKETFLEMAFKWCIDDGLTSKTYHMIPEHSHEYIPSMDSIINKLIHMKNSDESYKIIKEKTSYSITDFIHDGLRWSLLFEIR